MPRIFFRQVEIQNRADQAEVRESLREISQESAAARVDLFREKAERTGLREQLLEQSKALTSEIREKHDQMKAGLNHEAEQIRSAMTGRESLAEMLSEVALRLKNEFRVPGA